MTPFGTTIMQPSPASARKRAAAAAAFAALLVCASALPARAQIVAVVNGEPITATDIAQRSKLIQISTGDPNAYVAGWTSRAGLEDPRKVAVSKWCADNTVDHVVSTLLAAEIPVAPVKTIPQVADDPHLWEREMLVKMPDALAGEIHVPGATIKMSKTPGRVGHVPTPGEHTDEVLSGLLGYDRATLSELRAAKVIA